MRTIFSKCGKQANLTNTDSRPVYIHYGSNAFDKYKFKQAETRYSGSESNIWIKPKHGLWASRKDSPKGWNIWITENNLSYEYPIFDSFAFKLKTNAKIFNIKSSKDLQRLKEFGVYKKHDFLYGIDINPLIKKGYDGIELFINSELYWDLYGWDCDSIILFNSDCIELIDQ